MTHLQLAELQVFVSDLADARAFYGGLLGFELDGEGETWLSYRVGSLPLIVMNGATREPRTRGYGKERATVLVFEVEGLEDTLQALREQGASIVEELRETKHGKLAAIQDPDGNLVELIET